MSSIELAANPLLSREPLPLFNAIKPHHVLPAIESLINDARATLAECLRKISQGEAPTWETLIAPLEEADDRLNKAWAPVGHLHGVQNNEELRLVYNEAIALLTQYSTEVGQNRELFAAYEALRASSHFDALTQAQKQVIDNAIRDFKLAGVALAEDKKKRYGEIKQRLSELTTQFSNNLLDATQAWYFHTENIEDLAGLPESAIAQTQKAAKDKNLAGYVVTLDFPSYYAVMMHADNRALREAVYRAYVTRASDLAVNNEGSALPQYDNTAIMHEIVALRQELAKLVGFDNYAERSLATKMAESPESVFNFLNDLAIKAKPFAERDLAELKAFAAARGVDELKVWDTTYFSEKLREEKYAISQEAIKVYFPFEQVLEGLFNIVNKLFSVDIKEDDSVEKYHTDVRFYKIYQQGDPIAAFYLDAFARENKRSGAWMDDCRVRRQSVSGLQIPVAFLVGNFTPAIEGKPALLTHDEVITLFHEFGHGLHHMLTKVDVAAVSGINGVAWDAVELPSQFMENWCWQPEALAILSRHVETGEPLPDDLLKKMLAAKNFQSGLFILRQLEFALFDFTLHSISDSSLLRIHDVLQEVRGKISVMQPPEFNRFENSFSHIFAGGYAAGYYSYLWAEVLSADAFSAFEDTHIFDSATAQRFLTEILERGGSESPMALFTQFRGRAPKVEALLRHSGLIEEAA